MKILKNIVIGNIQKQLISTNIILELSACGRGFVVVDAQQNESFINKTVKIDIGYHNNVQRWFTGYVESEQVAQTGTKKLMVRELIGIYAKKFDCSFQHPTIKIITDYLTANYHLAFDLPNADYINTKIPHFKHSGTGFHLLNAIGHAFNINDFIFYQKQSGVIYLGSHNDSYYFDKNIDIGDNLNKSALKTASVNSVTLPFIPKIRPGVILNNRRVKQVNLADDELTLIFDNQDLAPFEKQLAKTHPEISANYHVPMFGRVVAISDICGTGNISTPFRPRYAVDIQLLDENGDDAKAPIFKAVPLPVALGSWEKGVFCYPDIGTIADLSFAYGRADQPIIRNIYPTNIAVPAVSHGEILLQQRQEVYQRIDKVGNVTRETDQELHDISRDHYINADYQESNIIERKTTIAANDEVNILGNQSVNAGAISTAVIQDYGLSVGGNYYQYVKQNYELTINANQTIKINQNKQESISNGYTLKANTIDVTAVDAIKVAAKQISEQATTIHAIMAGSSVQVTAPSIWLGSETINVTQCMLDTLKLIKRLADLTAEHVHGNTSPPTTSAAISKVGIDAVSTNNKYSSIIEK